MLVYLLILSLKKVPDREKGNPGSGKLSQE